VEKLYITGRERKIIEILLQSEHEITLGELASQLQVSNRTVQRDLKHVEEMLQDYHLTLKRKPGFGLELHGSEANKFDLSLILTGVKYTDFTPDERHAIILLALLEANEPLKLYILANELKVTEATVSNDLDQIQKELKEYQLTLVRKRGYGIKIVGKERNKRAAISHLISKHVDEIDLISLLKSNIKLKSGQNNVEIFNRLLGIINPENLSIIENEVEKIRASLPYGLADSAYIGLVVHLALVIERLKNGDIIEFDPTYLEQIQPLQEYKLASKMIKQLEQSLDITIPKDEIGYITMHLLGAKLRIDHNYLIEDSNLGIAYNAKKLIQFVSEQYGEDLMNNYGLLNDLVAHLKPAIYRLKQQMNIKNPMINDILKNYRDLFDVVKTGVNKIFVGIEFPDEEIGYLVLHFGSALINSKADNPLTALVICPSGIGSAKMLAEQLQKKLPEIKHVDNLSIFDLDKALESQYDLIVSTIPLQSSTNYILASPFLTKDDINRIKKAIRKTQINPSSLKKQQVPNKKSPSKTDLSQRLQTIQNFSKSTLDLLTSFDVIPLEQKGTIEETLAYICDILEKNKVINDKSKVLTDIIERQSSGGLGIPETELALYHTRTNGVQNISFTIFPLQTPIEIMSMNEQTMNCTTILFMLAPIDPSQEILEILSFLSSVIIQDDKSIQTFESANRGEIFSFLSEQLNHFINSKLT